MLSLGNATKVFIELLMSSVHNPTFQSIKKLLFEGPLGRKKDPELLKLQNWYINLNDHEREFVPRIVKESVNLTIFDLLVLLDNKTAGYPVPGEVSDIALFVNIYQDQESLEKYNPKEAVRINRSYTPDDDLHDLYMYSLLEQEKGTTMGSIE